ncbi:MAG: hypothetical protein KDK51_10175 [Deltaproteobacteria bacterium]|nr:hypothetical protein [Deltaproteobacteria bacterium]
MIKRTFFVGLCCFLGLIYQANAQQGIWKLVVDPDCDLSIGLEQKTNQTWSQVGSFSKYILNLTYKGMTDDQMGYFAMFQNPDPIHIGTDRNNLVPTDFSLALLVAKPKNSFGATLQVITDEATYTSKTIEGELVQYSTVHEADQSNRPFSLTVHMPHEEYPDDYRYKMVAACQSPFSLK